MRLIDGTPQEIAEFLRLTEGLEEGADSRALADGVDGYAEPTASDEDVAWSEVEDLARERARTPQIAERVLEFLKGALALGGVEIGPGASERTRDGKTDYIMVRDAGSRRYGAVVYVQAASGGLTLRLMREDVADLDEPDHISFREVQASQPYAVNCPLKNDSSIKVALMLTERALRKVRG